MADYIWATGRRKTAIARVRLSTGDGKILVNERPVEKYFQNEMDKYVALEPLAVTNRMGKYDVFIRVTGGGPAGQAGGVRHGIARSLAQVEPELIPILKQNKFLTRDPRMKERKKYGLRGARRGQQYSKR
jgi:small subunit ribosomal protein S9